VRLALINREKLQALGSALVAEFDNLVSRIRTGWGVEHTEAGGHTEVHAETLSTGRLVFSDIVTDNLNVPLIHNYDPGGFNTASVLRVNPASDGAMISGLRVPLDAAGNVLDGRVLVLENVTEQGRHIRLAHENSPEGQGSFARNRFRLPRQPLPVNASSEFVVHPSMFVTLIYNAPKARWVIASSSIDQSIAYFQMSASVFTVSMPNHWAAKTWRIIPTARDLLVLAFTSAGVPDDEIRTLVNDGNYALRLLHAHPSGAAADRLYCPGGMRYMLNPRESVDLQKIRGGGWRLLLKADQWIDAPWSASWFTGSGGSWAPGTVNTFAYQLDGNKMTVSFHLTAMTITGTPGVLLLIIPDNRLAARNMSVRLALAWDATGFRTNAVVSTNPGQGYLYFHVDPFGSQNWAAVSAGAYFLGQITFWVKEDHQIQEPHTDVLHADSGHADAEHGDIAHVDAIHVDSHGDTAHGDGTHADVIHNDFHTDNVHLDTHSDVAHNDTHTDVAHVDIPHTDFNHIDAHTDSPHGDTAHQDQAFHDVPFQDYHSDAGHFDQHGDQILNHSDSHTDQTHGDCQGHTDAFQHCDGMQHWDAHGDQQIDGDHYDNHGDTPIHTDTHGDAGTHDDTHTDAPHVDVHNDQFHDDVPHQDVTHSDAVHQDTHDDLASLYTPHYDTPHSDLHTDGAHTDSHTDIPHEDSHTDVLHQDASHADVTHSDSHSDVPHSDTLHTDQGHTDAPHGDAGHQDAGLHTDENHTDF